MVLRSLLSVRRARRGRARVAIAASAAGLLLGSAMLAGATPSFAVHDTGRFELDGNIANSGDATFDWADLFNADGTRKVVPDPAAGPVLASAFAVDTATPDASYFATSDSDLDAVSDWQCGSKNNPQNKTDLQNAYAALLRIPADAKDNAGSDVVYLGSERDSNDGDAYAGFWLLQDEQVGCTDGNFTGHHRDGDLLIRSDYTNGGGAQTVQVYRWTGDDATGSPVLVVDGNLCGGPDSDETCGIANSSAVSSPWAPTTHDANEFVEVGLDLGNLPGGGQVCFSRFLAETRASQEITAQLKDFTLGSLDTCPAAPIRTTASGNAALNAPGSAQTDSATLTAVGSRPVPTGTVAFYLCAPDEVTDGQGCVTGGTKIGDDVTLTGGAAQSAVAGGDRTTALGTYCWRAEYTPDADSAGRYRASTHTNADSECFEIVHADPTITTTASVDGDRLGSLGITSTGDTATLAGYLGSVEGESVDFALYGPYAADVTPDCTGDPAFTSSAKLDGKGVATLPADSYTPTEPGTYVWVASYAGNPLNSPAAEACNNEDEKVTIRAGLVGIVKSADADSVPAGTQIGFDIVVSNSGDGTATDVTVHDELPAGPAGNLDWTLDPAYEGCAITGEVGTQVLDCTLGDVTPGTTLDAIHVVADTQLDDCGTITNTASVDSDNAGSTQDDASVDVNCAALAITKTADADSVQAGEQIGFTIEVTNTSENDAVNVTLTDPLPAGDDIDWVIDPADEGCSIDELEGVRTLTCSAETLAAGETATVHVVSDTTEASCALYQNVATVAAQNAAEQQAAAQENVICVAVVTDPPPSTPQQGVDPITPIARTGAGPLQLQVGWALGLLVAGGAFALFGRRRRAH